MKLDRRILVIVFVFLFALAIMVATVTAAYSGTAKEIPEPIFPIAATDMQGEAGTMGSPISANAHRLISPWSIDEGRNSVLF